jgi:uncharacterized protein YbaP (TraB family)
MKRSLIILCCIPALVFCIFFQASAQRLQKGLLWEITGKGLSKPSYLYGTMHVSSKLAFNLSDSFFIAIKNCDRVALETSPENWLEEFMSTRFMSHMIRVQNSGGAAGSNPITIGDFTWFKEFYSKDYIKLALSKDPNMLNQLMFRHTSNKQDFEEDTYLDLYIFQVASKLRKPVVSVEELDESLGLVMQAYTDMYPEDRERKYNPNFDQQLEEYYRQADLEQIDSLMQKQGYSETYFDRMLYTRNKNMAASMDSFMRLGPLFTGVGAAHLPGEKGLISQLRQMGYTVRAVNLGHRNAAMRNKLDKIEVPVTYRRFTSADGLFSIDAPGKLLAMPDNAMTQQYLYTDMMNGSFYVVNRIKILTTFLGYSEEYVKKSVDSLLYEYIPGNIMSMKPLEINGYKAYDIVNRTRRGDMQYYRIVFTPLELFVVKTGGKGNYVKKNGLQFIRSFVVNRPNATPEKLHDEKNGFEITLPAQPVVNFGPTALSNYSPGVHLFQLIDNDGSKYFILKQTKINKEYLEEDSVELNLVEKGFTERLGLQRTGRNYRSAEGFPYLTCTYANEEKDKYMIATYAFKGPHVYVVSAWCANEAALDKAKGTISSFRIIPDISKEGYLQNDTVHKFSVVSPVPLPPDVNTYNFSFRKRDEKNNHTTQNEYITYTDAETGEQVSLRWMRLHKYFMSDDTAKFWKAELAEMNDGRFIEKVKYYNKDGAICADIIFSDTNTSRVILVKEIIKGRYIYTLSAESDTVTMGNNFVRGFFATFQPNDTTRTYDPFTNRTQQLLDDLLSDDSTTYAQARQLVSSTRFIGKSYKSIAETIGKLKDDKYKKDLRIELVLEIGYRKDASAIPYLREQYNTAGDDYDYQLAVLKALASVNTAASYKACKELLLSDPPFVSDEYMYYRLFDYLSSDDSLWNRKQFLPDVLKLAVNDEYKIHVYEMLAEAIDSNKITPALYQPYMAGIINDARKVLKQELTKDETENPNMNYNLETYNKLLIGQYDKNAQVREYFDKQLKAGNFHVKAYAVAIMLANKKAIQDTIIYNLASNLESRLNFFYALRDYKQESRFPAEFSKQEMLAYCFTRSMVNPSYGDNKLDTLILLDTAVTYFRGKTGRMYFYKYKLRKSDDWRTYATGMQVSDPAVFDFTAKLNGKGVKVFDDRKTIAEQFMEVVEQSKEAARSNEYYGGYEGDYMDSGGYMDEE